MSASTSADAVHGVRDRAVAGAPAEIALERMREIGALLLIERRHRHDHAGGAEAALKRLRVEKSLLHRMQVAVWREPLDRRHRAPRGAESRNQAGVHRLAVEPDRAGAAVAGVAALLDAEDARLPQEGPQALPGLRLGRELSLPLTWCSSCRAPAWSVTNRSCAAPVAPARRGFVRRNSG